MARNRQNLNIIYISDRMRETLRPIASCALTAVVAPMGYGKTTAVRWFLAEQAKAGAVVLQASIYSDNRSIFWKSVQKAFAAAGLTVLEGYDCPADASGAALLLEDLCAALGGKTPYYLFLDDFHLLGDERVAQFLCRLAYRLPENVHLIVASRNRFLPGEQVVRLGRRLHHIEADGLRLNREELLAYTHRCGVEITAAQAESLLRSCEGWFSAVYLNLHALAERGSLLQPGSDIYAMFTAAMLESLPEKTRGFLAVMGLADEFTVEMARAVTALPDAEEVLRALTQQNAFVTRLPDGVSFRFHHMMKECAERLFAQLPAARQTDVWQRYGRWYAQKAQYLHALQAFEHCGDRDAALAVIEADAGDLLASLSPAELLQRLDSFRSRMAQGTLNGLERQERRLKALAEKRVLTDPLAFVQDKRLQLDYVQQKLLTAANAQWQEEQRRFAALAAKLDALSPLKVLGRGYAMARTEDGAVLRTAAQVQSGDTIHLRLAQGGLRCTVTEKEEA